MVVVRHDRARCCGCRRCRGGSGGGRAAAAGATHKGWKKHIVVVWWLWRLWPDGSVGVDGPLLLIIGLFEGLWLVLSDPNLGRIPYGKDNHHQELDPKHNGPRPILPPILLLKPSPYLANRNLSSGLLSLLFPQDTTTTMTLTIASAAWTCVGCVWTQR